MHLLLVHGLGRTPLSMRSLGRRLARTGHAPEYFGYYPWRESWNQIVARLTVRVVEIEARGEPWAAVGHSLGGLLLREVSVRSPCTNLTHLVMLGTPNRPPRLARRTLPILPLRWFLGECLFRLADAEFVQQVPTPRVPYTVIAGTRGVYGPASPFGRELNDGVIALGEARLGYNDALYTFPVSHTFMMNRREVQEVVVELLSRGVTESRGREVPGSRGR